MAEYGIRVVQPGQDIDYTPPDEVSYSSEFQSPKVYRPYRGVIKGDANGDGSVKVLHDIVYSPQGEAFYKTPARGWRSIDNYNIGLETNPGNFVLRFRKSQGSPYPEFVNADVQYKVYILLDPAQGVI